jgi:hypothetical protein
MLHDSVADASPSAFSFDDRGRPQAQRTSSRHQAFSLRSNQKVEGQTQCAVQTVYDNACAETIRNILLVQSAGSENAMAEPVTMAPAIETLQIALASALGRWNLSPRTKISFLSHSENTTFLASDPETGRELVLRIHRIDYHTRAEILSELAWIAALVADSVVDTPGPVADREGNLLCALHAGGLMRNVVAFERMSGHEPDQSASLPAWFRKLGELSARLHSHSRRWPRPRTFERKTWDFDAMLGTRPLWGDWRAGIGLPDSTVQLLQRVADGIVFHGIVRHRAGSSRGRSP